MGRMSGDRIAYKNRGRWEELWPCECCTRFLSPKSTSSVTQLKTHNRLSAPITTDSYNRNTSPNIKLQHRRRPRAKDWKDSPP